MEAVMADYYDFDNFDLQKFLDDWEAVYAFLFN
nr:MAG TPA: hypothetical protein [Caudoviricetes sp.]